MGNIRQQVKLWVQMKHPRQYLYMRRKGAEYEFWVILTIAGRDREGAPNAKRPNSHRGRSSEETNVTVAK